MEGMLDRHFTLGGRGTRDVRKARRNKVHLVRYADDFVVTAATPEVAEEARAMVADFLAVRGLELSKEKTLVTHVDAGFDFLSWKFRKHGGKLIIKPSKRAVSAFLRETHKLILRESGGMDADELIRALAPKVRGFANYHRHTCCSETFSKMGHVMFLQLFRRARRRHPKKSKTWVYNSYWRRAGGSQLVFSTQDRLLPPITRSHVVRHVPLKTLMNPYLDREYFAARRELLRSRGSLSFRRPAVS